MRIIRIIDEKKSAQRERLFFIEFTLVFLGALRRKDLVKQFAISEAAATKDLGLYSEICPHVLNYDFRRKSYAYTGGPLQFNHDVDHSLFSLTGERPINQSIDHPARIRAAVGPSIKRIVSLEIASAITRCIHQHRRMTAVYRSIGGGERERRLTPLALNHDGLRWHIRCYDEDASDFKDHNLARFVTVKEGLESAVSLDDDQAWMQEVTLELVVHPESPHPETVRLDYGIEDGIKRVKIRSCLVGYFLRRWPIDFTDDASSNPRQHHLYLANKSKLLRSGVTEWAFM